MPAVRNRVNHSIYIGRLGAHLAAREEVEVTRQQFDALRGHPLLEPVTEPAAKKATVKKEGDEQ